MVKKKVNKHPRLYEIYKPNDLIQARKGNMTFMEQRVYNELLNNNHVKEPDRLIYQVSYEHIFDYSDGSNRRKNIKRIADQLQTRYFIFDNEFMMEHFGKDSSHSFNPFPEISYHKEFFEVQISPKLKKILTMINLPAGFTKGDIDTLRDFKHEISNPFYWLVRQRQTWGNTWQVELEELKASLGLEGKYEVYSNFKKKVLDAVKEDFTGTWVEFDYEPLKKGKSGAVHSIRFLFKNGPKQLKDGPAGEDFSWEADMLRLGVAEEKVKEIRQRVKAAGETDQGFVWDSEYVRFSLTAAKEQLAEIKKDHNRSQVKNTGAWVYSGLMEGRWIIYVNQRREILNQQVQVNLDFTTTPPAQTDQPATKQIIKIGSGDERIIIPPEKELKEMEELYEEMKPALRGKTLEEFMQMNHYEQRNGQWLKFV